MVSLDVTKALTIIRLKMEAKELYEEIDVLTREILEEFGEGRFDFEIPDSGSVDGSVYHLAEKLREKGGYFYIEILDNARRLILGEPVFRTMTVAPVSFKHRTLKNKPKSMK